MGNEHPLIVRDREIRANNLVRLANPSRKDTYGRVDGQLGESRTSEGNDRDGSGEELHCCLLVLFVIG
jgi:hypothetical protein